MTAEVVSQWVVRLLDRLVLLQRPVKEIRVFSTAEVLQFKTYYGSGESKSRIEQQHDINARQEGVTFAYWVVLFPLDGDLATPLDVLCCTVQRETAERILDELWLSLFTNCGDNTLVDLRQVLAADLVTPETVATTPLAGRFVDLGDGDLRRPVAAAASIAEAAIPVQTVPTRRLPERDVRNVRDVQRQPDPLWIRTTTGTGGSQGVANANGDIFAIYGDGRSAVDNLVAVENVGPRPPMVHRSRTVLPQLDTIQARCETPLLTPERVAGDPMTGYRPAPQEGRNRNTANLHDAADIEQGMILPADLAAMMQQSTVPNIGRGMDRNADALSPRERDRLHTQIHAAWIRQQADNRNTHATVLPSGVDYAEYLLPEEDGPGQHDPPDNDAVDRDDLDF